MEAIPPPEGVLTTSLLLERLGGYAAIGCGALIRLQFTLEGRVLCLDIRCVQGTLVVGKLTIGDRAIWEGQIDLRTVDLMQVARTALSAAAPAPVSTPPATALSAPTASPDDGAPAAFEIPPLTPGFAYGLPVAGEIWSMNLEVIQDSGQEVRYVSYNPNGERFGAPRVLPRNEFLDMVSAVSGKLYRMNVAVGAGGVDQVSYQQLNSQRQVTGSPRTISTQLFVATFSPEATLY